jgi:hypothetical protein
VSLGNLGNFGNLGNLGNLGNGVIGRQVNLFIFDCPSQPF